ncbi:unnamed protein product [Caenorhabditis auriculariae]|uniref:Uncharacterized protein n=1 Tax=Caenorhabditis auriculariae TaxID=2777116 RepID=A0A8S1GR32_9PELO|nr:unnamed protein product [Caenorhabditis auriculariae]
MSPSADDEPKQLLLLAYEQLSLVCLGEYSYVMSWKMKDEVKDGDSTFGRDLESVAFAVLLFLLGGVVLFISCFIVTKCLQCYKARQRRLRRLAMGEDDEIDSLDFEEETPCHDSGNPPLVHL